MQNAAADAAVKLKHFRAARLLIWVSFLQLARHLGVRLQP